MMLFLTVVALLVADHVTNGWIPYSAVRRNNIGGLFATVVDRDSSSSSSSSSEGGGSSNKKRQYQQPHHQKPKPKRRFGQKLDIVQRNYKRVSTAGREGTMSFVDPTRIFIGNLNYTTTKEDLYDFLGKTAGWKSDNDNQNNNNNNGGSFKSILNQENIIELYIRKIQLVRDWKTNESKGYAFVTFTEPIYATWVLHNCNGIEYMGRKLTIKPAKHKLTPKQRRKLEKQNIKKAKRDALIAQGIDPKTILNDQQKREIEKRNPIENPNFLQLLDPDLIVQRNVPAPPKDDDDDEGEAEQQPEQPKYHHEEFDYTDDSLLFNDDDDDEELVFDGDEFDYLLDDDEEQKNEEEEKGGPSSSSSSTLNREQRRKFARQQPKRKPKFKGFGSK